MIPLSADGGRQKYRRYRLQFRETENTQFRAENRPRETFLADRTAYRVDSTMEKGKS